MTMFGSDGNGSTFHGSIFIVFVYIVVAPDPFRRRPEITFSKGILRTACSSKTIVCRLIVNRFQSAQAHATSIEFQTKDKLPIELSFGFMWRFCAYGAWMGEGWITSSAVIAVMVVCVCVWCAKKAHSFVRHHFP